MASSIFFVAALSRVNCANAGSVKNVKSAKQSNRIDNRRYTESSKRGAPRRGPEVAGRIMAGRPCAGKN